MLLLQPSNTTKSSFSACSHSTKQNHVTFVKVSFSCSVQKNYCLDTRKGSIHCHSPGWNQLAQPACFGDQRNFWGPKESEENVRGTKECLSMSQFHLNTFNTTYLDSTASLCSQPNQELRLLSSATRNCQVTMIFMNWDWQIVKKLFMRKVHGGPFVIIFYALPISKTGRLV